MKIIVCIAMFALLNGCATTVATIATSNMPKSKYTPMILSESDVDAWLATIRPVSRQVVSDELGTYYFDVREDGVYSAALSAKDAEAMRNLFSGSVGLLEPVYVYGDDLQVRPDWKETERRHQYLTKTIRLSLLPMEATRRYHELVDKKARSTVQRTVSMSDALSGNMGLYNPDYHRDIVQKMPGQFSYIVNTIGGAGTYYTTVQSDARLSMAGRSPRKPGPAQYRAIATQYRTGQGMAFGLVEAFRDLKSGGGAAASSSGGCNFISPDEWKKGIRETKAATDIPYASGISAAMRERDPEQLSLAKAEFVKAREQQQAAMQRHEAACAGLREIGIAGRIGSQKLD